MTNASGYAGGVKMIIRSLPVAGAAHGGAAAGECVRSSLHSSSVPPAPCQPPKQKNTVKHAKTRFVFGSPSQKTQGSTPVPDGLKLNL